MKRRRAARRKITHRWMINNLSVIIAVLLVFEIMFMVAARGYFYQNVQYVLTSRAQVLTDSFLTYQSERISGFEDMAREFVGNFAEKEKMELQVVDASGNVLVSSSGFQPAEEKMPDYSLASSSEDGQGVWRGRNSAGENIMALSIVVKDKNGATEGMLRYLVSLKLIDRQLLIMLGIMMLFSVIVVFFVVLSSAYFVNSIVYPVTEIGRAARRIALGDYDYRLAKKYDDEIGDLCDTINYMAGEISTAEHMKNEFISSVSHELRTPLTAIKGWGETLRQGGAGDPELMDKGLDVIIGEAERLSGIVEELLDFSRMQGGHLNMKFSRMDLLAELSETVLLFRERADRAGVTLEYLEPENLPPIVGDKDRLKQVFINVIDNAIKYSDQGGRVRIETADMGGHIQVVVGDTGVGIAAADLPHIKQKFYKANRSRPGSGIGLALADEIIRRHKGRLDIDSEEGVGTTVTIMLPACPPESAKASGGQTER